MTEPTKADDLVERLIGQFNSICNAYKGYLPDVETPDIRTRLMHVADATKAFDAAITALRAQLAEAKQSCEDQKQQIYDRAYRAESSLARARISREEMLALIEERLKNKAGLYYHELVPVAAALRSQAGKATEQSAMRDDDMKALNDLVSIAEEHRFSPHSLGIAFRNSLDAVKNLLATLQSPPTNARSEDIAIALCLVDGRDPDEKAPISEMCDDANMPVPW